MTYKHKSYGYCNRCGFGSCKHLDENKIQDDYLEKFKEEMSKILFNTNARKEE